MESSGSIPCCETIRETVVMDYELIVFSICFVLTFVITFAAFKSIP